jgi:hypothetical protein
MEPHLSILSADICYRPHKDLPYIENLDAWLSDIVTPSNGSLGVRGGDWFGSLRPFWTPSNFLSASSTDSSSLRLGETI